MPAVRSSPILYLYPVAGDLLHRLDLLRQRRAGGQQRVDFLPVYLGPTLMAVLFWFVLRRIVRITKVHRITTIATSWPPATARAACWPGW